MSFGRLARRLLSESAFRALARRYRKLFVDLNQLAGCLPEIPQQATLVDIGGGDGDIHNRLLDRHKTARSVLLDPGPQVGGFIEQRFASRVVKLPGTSLEELTAHHLIRAQAEAPAHDTVAANRGRIDWLLVFDVFHHVPRPQRPDFANRLRKLVEDLGTPHTVVIVKDVQPGSARAALAWLLDRFVSGDRWVHFLRQDELRALVAEAFPEFACEDTPLLAKDGFNYCHIWRRLPPEPPNA